MVRVELTKVSLPVSLGYPLINTRKHQLSVEIGLLPALGKETFEQSTYIVGNYNKENEGILYQKMADVGAAKVTESTSKWVGTGLYTFYILGIGAILSIVYSGVKGIFSK